MGGQPVRHGPRPQKQAFRAGPWLGLSRRTVNRRKHHFGQRHCCFSRWNQKDSQTVQGKAKNHPRQPLLPRPQKILFLKEKWKLNALWSLEQIFPTGLCQPLTQVVRIPPNRTFNTQDQPNWATQLNRWDFITSPRQHWGGREGRQHGNIFGEHFRNVIHSKYQLSQNVRLGRMR